jgi:hypothetical protein
MKLANADNLNYISVFSRDQFVISEKQYPEEYSVIKSPIKIKFDKDIIALFYAHEDENTGEQKISFSVLHSTQRKFKDDYVKEVIYSRVSYDSMLAKLKFI